MTISLSLRQSLAFGAAITLIGCSGESVAPTVDDVATSVSASAVSLRVRCERRFSPNRSKISVDANNVSPGARFSARVRSGSNVRTSGLRRAVGDEVEFDFDSNTGEGGTQIAPTFIQLSATPDVIGTLLNASGAVVARAGVNCRVQ